MQHLLKKLFNSNNAAKKVHFLTLGLIALIFIWGLSMVCFEIKPFWIDEWRLIANIKFKNQDALWGKLDFTQQFPRVFLQVIKWFTESFNYNYFSLRFPSLIISVCSMILVVQLMKKTYPKPSVARYLFVLIFISAQTFTDYLVQMKHYEMELLLSLVAIGQCYLMQRLVSTNSIASSTYLLLCLSFAVAPFFSYTYPIAVSPIFVLMIYNLGTLKNKLSATQILKLSLPLIIAASSILILYKIDVAQLMKDEEMHRYWSYQMIQGNFSIGSIAEKIWGLFAKVGSGLLFEIIFGTLGITAFLYHIIYKIKKQKDNNGLLHYASILLVVVLILFFAGKIPMSESKFNAFTVPAISILIIQLLQDGLKNLKTKKLSQSLLIILFLGLTGNIVSTIINTFTDKNYSKRMAIYHRTNEAIELAQKQHIPILITPNVGFPDDLVHFAPNLSKLPPSWVLRTFPSFSAKNSINVIDIENLDQYTFPKTRKAIVGDGLNFKIINK